MTNSTAAVVLHLQMRSSDKEREFGREPLEGG